MSAGKREERQLPSRTIAEAIRTKIESGELRPRAKLTRLVMRGDMTGLLYDVPAG